MSAPDAPRAVPRDASHRAVLSIALPAMATNVATALFGMADTWVIGRLNDADAQAGVELGAKLLMAILVLFNFLRSSTVALTAQASGRGESGEQAAILVRALAAALAVAALLLATRDLVMRSGLSLFGASGSPASFARTYVAARYPQGAVWLVNAAVTGWLIGRRRMRGVLAVEVASNLVHIGLDVGFVLGLGLGVKGVAIATLLSEIVKSAALVALARRQAPSRMALRALTAAATWARPALVGVFHLNRDLFLRTVLLMSATVMLTRAGARLGAPILAANAVIYQLFMFSALLLDGFESAAQVLCGEALGAGSATAFIRRMRTSFLWGAGAAVLLTILYALVGAPFERSFATAPSVLAALARHGGWAVVLPAAGVASYIFDGVFIGANWTRAMLMSMAIALAGFVGLLWAARSFGDDGLWAAFAAFLVLRALVQASMIRGLVARSLTTVDAPASAPPT